jgi:hypothetical protein
MPGAAFPTAMTDARALSAMSRPAAALRVVAAALAA